MKTKLFTTEEITTKKETFYDAKRMLTFLFVLLISQGPPGSFDFLLLLMADIRNDIADLQSKVYGRPMHSTEEDIPLAPDRWRDTADNLDAGSGEDYKEPQSQTGRWSKRNKKRKPGRERTN